MSHREGQADQHHDQSSVIVQAPDTWRKPIQAALENANIQLRYSKPQKSGIASRLKQLQAEQTVTLAAEVAHNTDAMGAAIVLTEDLPGILVTLAFHHDEQTELHLWSFETSETAMEFLVATVSQITSTNSSIPSDERHVTNRQELFSDLHDKPEFWTLNEDRKFHSSSVLPGTGILSGSFNPLHSGHRKMRKAAAEILGAQVVYEMTLRNADKPPLDYLSLSARAGQFSPGELLLTTVPTFSEKADLLSQSTFIIGWDTALRVLDQRFYAAGELELALEKFADQECRFLVAARRDRGRLQSLDILTIPGKFRDLFAEIPPELFQEDISSTSVRDAWLRGESNIGPPLCMMVETHTQ
ncbi:hypothetical protein OAK47_02675 [Planctomycetaceae bacterium]|jgi:hypothetical protein|nr:hypothetical protein [Planctomycetaceae bacterium]MDC0262107.1 hypothetical protein [Planctomycetaceae bacterium]MDG2389563.1 hypothetical protein [Planctomycetaceae bacterium]